MVTLLFLVRDVGMRTSLENSNLLAVTSFDIGTGEVAGIFIFLACPYVINLSCHQHRSLHRITHCVIEPVYFAVGQFACISIKEVNFCFSNINGVVDNFCHHRRAVVHDGVILSCNNSKMATLGRICSIVIRRSVGLNNIFIQERRGR